MDVKFSIRDPGPVVIDAEKLGALIAIVADVLVHNRKQTLDRFGLSDQQLTVTDVLDPEYMRAYEASETLKYALMQSGEATYTGGKSIKVQASGEIMGVVQSESGSLDEIQLTADRGPLSIRISIGGNTASYFRSIYPALTMTYHLTGIALRPLLKIAGRTSLSFLKIG